MISARICAAEGKQEFMEFTHGTTCIVAVPHGVESELWISSDTPGTLVLEAAGREIKVMRLQPPGCTLKLSDLQQPLVQQPKSLGSILKALNPLRRPAPQPPASQRLYNFRAIIEDGSPRQRGDVLATFDFHLLCEVDFHWARVYHLELDRKSNQAKTIAERAEGTCPLCHEARLRLQKNWNYET